MRNVTPRLFETFGRDATLGFREPRALSRSVTRHRPFTLWTLIKEGVTAFIDDNALSRGAPVVEAMLDRGVAYASGPQWLAEQMLWDKHVLAVAGTHGKTTTSSMLAFILEHAGLAPGFLIGGVPCNFDATARLGSGR